MTTLSTEDNTRPGADDHDSDGFNPVIEARRREYDGGLSSARGSREFFRAHRELEAEIISAIVARLSYVTAPLYYARDRDD
jgi:hypothetical protein